MDCDLLWKINVELNGYEMRCLSAEGEKKPTTEPSPALSWQ
jgi:hypothetical protein